MARILIACEESQAVTIEFRKLGIEAYSCDVESCSGGYPEWHIQKDVLEILNDKWDMIIGFPPCTYLSNAGACRLYPQKGVLNLERYNKGIEAKQFFMSILNADCPRIAVENPVSSKIFEMPTHTHKRSNHMSSDILTQRRLDFGSKVYQNLLLQILSNLSVHMFQQEQEEKTDQNTVQLNVARIQKIAVRLLQELHKQWQGSGRCY